MEFVFGFFIGLLVGSVAFYFVYKNNKTKIDAIAKLIESEIANNEAVAKIKDIIK
jgi:hypothetical protein